MTRCRYGELLLVFLRCTLSGGGWVMRTALYALIATDVWQWTPFCFLVCLAGLEDHPQNHMNHED